MRPSRLRCLGRRCLLVLAVVATCFAVTSSARADLIVAPTPSNSVTPPVYTPVPSATQAADRSSDTTDHRGTTVLALVAVGGLAAGSLVGLRRLRRAGPGETPTAEAGTKEQPNGDSGHDT